MSAVTRDEILDYVTYGEQREAIRAAASQAKEARRVIVAEVLTFLFENHETVRFQVLEMVRTERLVKEAEIQHELDTYNELLGDAEHLGCTLLLGIDDAAVRDVKLREWIDLPAHLYVLLPDGERARPTHDPRQVGEERLSSVQFLKFRTGGQVPVAVGCDHPTLTAETPLAPERQAALEADLRAWGASL